MSRDEPLVVVANRLPITWTDGAGWTASAGGLVTALEDALVGDRLHWVGWAGADEPAPPEWRGIRLRSVPLSEDEVAGYYDGFSNSCLWPLMHDGLRPSRMDWDWWRCYETVNERFAVAAAEVAPPGATVWIHDYHLLLMPAMLRRRRPDLHIGYYHHIPFPPPMLFQRLPWRDQLIEGLLGADLLGFQIASDAEAFRATAAQRGWSVRGGSVVGSDGRHTLVSHFPATIDPAPLEAVASEPATIEAAKAFRDAIGSERKILVGVDRLDWTKAITARLEAFGALLERRNDLIDQVAFVQVAVPSRDAVAEYQAECAEVQRLVGEINGRFANVGTAVVHFRHGSMERNELVALYRAADVMVVTPLRDGQNLVAKEFVSSRIDELGALVLSEFAGAAQELHEAVLVNPFDVAGMSAGYLQALEMPVPKQRLSMVRMRSAVRSWDARRWTTAYLTMLREAAAVSHGTAA
jgi:alpha,alpha-trehalose-phosphate synthase [UDP-forming]